MGGKYAPKPSSGPHRMPDCIPLCIVLMKKLKFAATKKELKYALNKKIIRINGKVRTDRHFPLGIMDILSIDSCNEHYRILYNCKRRFVVQKITGEEVNLLLDIVSKKKMENKNDPYLFTRSGLTFRFVDPAIKIKDTVKIDTRTGQIIGHLPFKTDMNVIVIKGKNIGCVGIIKNIEVHAGGYDIAYIVDAVGREFCTRSENVMIIGDSESLLISLPKGNGIKITEMEKSDAKYGKINKDEVVVEEEEQC